MLLCSNVGKRLEPVGKMGRAMLQGPFLHTIGNIVCNGKVKGTSIVDAVDQSVINLDIQVFTHFVAVEHKFTEVG